MPCGCGLMVSFFVCIFVYFSFFSYSPELSISSAFCTLSLVVFITWKYSLMSQMSRAMRAFSWVLISGSEVVYCSSLNFTPAFSPISRRVASMVSSMVNFSLNDSNFLYFPFNSFRCCSIYFMVKLITAPLATRLR